MSSYLANSVRTPLKKKSGTVSLNVVALRRGLAMKDSACNSGNGDRVVTIEGIADQHARFLRFLAVRVGDKAEAEDILHSAYVKALEREHQLRSDESIVAWFYRILRNSLIDHYRRSAARDHAHQRYAVEAPNSYVPELQEQSCMCIADLVTGLKSEYREAIERIDLGGESIEDFARAKAITMNNASVRLHRARKALAGQLILVCGVCAQHKCVDCTCHWTKL